MTIKLIFDTDANTTPKRLKELQAKGLTLEDRIDAPKEKISLKPDWTIFYDDGYETSLRNLGHTGILSSAGNLSGDSVSVETNVDMVLYSASHQNYYYFNRSVKFTQGDKSVEGHFK